MGFIAPQCYFFVLFTLSPHSFFLFVLFLSSPFPRLTVPRITAHHFSIAYATNRFPVQFDSLCKARLFQKVALHCGNSCPNFIPTPHQCCEWKVRKLNSRFPSAVLRVDCVAAFFLGGPILLRKCLRLHCSVFFFFSPFFFFLILQVCGRRRR